MLLQMFLIVVCAFFQVAISVTLRKRFWQTGPFKLLTNVVVFTLCLMMSPLSSSHELGSAFHHFALHDAMKKPIMLRTLSPGISLTELSPDIRTVDWSLKSSRNSALMSFGKGVVACISM